MLLGSAKLVGYLILSGIAEMKEEDKMEGGYFLSSGQYR